MWLCPLSSHRTGAWKTDTMQQWIYFAPNAWMSLGKLFLFTASAPRLI